MLPGDMRPPRDPFASWLGRVRVGRPGEEWPRGDAGALLPLCQVNTVELTERPELLRDIALVAVFASGSSGEVRAYPSLADLVPLSEDARSPDPKPIYWEPCADASTPGSRVGGEAPAGIPPSEFVLQVAGASGLVAVARRGEEWRLVPAER